MIFKCSKYNSFRLYYVYKKQITILLQKYRSICINNFNTTVTCYTITICLYGIGISNKHLIIVPNM